MKRKKTKERVDITLDIDLIKELHKERNGVPLSTYINMILKKRRKIK